MAGKGRPTTYTQELADAICERLAGGESLRSICRDEDMPAMSTVLLWVVKPDYKDFSEQYMCAREAAGYAHADRIVNTVQSVEDGTVDPSSAKVMLDGLKWAAERQAPKKHSPRQELTGVEGGSMKTDNNINIQFVGSDKGESDQDG